VDTLNFGGRVAVVTGSGRGIGRSIALLLARRGAKIVVNDLGVEVDGSGHDSSVSAGVVEEITSLGGIAVADSADVSTESGAKAVVQGALNAFGRIDILINNAGIIRPDEFGEESDGSLDSIISVNLCGSYRVTRAAWSHMTRQRYGRVVMTTSPASLGSPWAVSYSAAKGGVISLARSLAIAGEANGIRVNVFCPSAETRMIGVPGIGRPVDKAVGGRRRAGPDEVAPLAAFLAHESVPVTGEIFASTGTSVGRLFIGETRGYSAPLVGMEQVRDHWQEIMDVTGFSVPSSSTDHVRLRALAADLAE
jgi:NAD(P)-dependent dehydrogenase (short-subunit alcohol dehydrogenase family)